MIKSKNYIKIVSAFAIIIILLSVLIKSQSRFYSKEYYLKRISILNNDDFLNAIENEVVENKDSIKLIITYRSNRKKKLKKLNYFLNSHYKSYEKLKCSKVYPIWQMQRTGKLIRNDKLIIRSQILEYLKFGYMHDCELDAIEFFESEN